MNQPQSINMSLDCSESTALAELAAPIQQLHEAISVRLRGPVAPRDHDRTQLNKLDDTIGELGVGPHRAIQEFIDYILPACTAIASPRYWGLINCSPIPLATALESAIARINNNLGAENQGPAADYCEKKIIEAFASLLDWNSSSDGHLVPGGSAANLHGLALARHQQNPNWKHDTSTSKGIPVVYTSQAAHFSAQRAAQTLGLGTQNVRFISSRGRGHMCALELDEIIREDLANGFRPMAVIGTAGTTGTGAIDPIHEIAAICRRYEVWLHIDAYYGGAGLLLPELRDAFNGIEFADSISIDPHKWFFMPLGCALVLVKDNRHTLDCFSVLESSYIPDRGVHGFERGLQTSRRATSLSLWTVLRSHGWQSLRNAVRHTIDCTRYLERCLSERGFQVLADGQLSNACARLEPNDWSPADCNAFQQTLAQTCREEGHSWFSTTMHQHSVWLRFCNVNLYCTHEDVEEMAKHVHATALRLIQESNSSFGAPLAVRQDPQ